MDKIISVTEFRRSLGAVFDKVAKKHATYVITRRGKSEAALIPYSLYRRYLQADEAGVLRRMDAVLKRMSVVNARFSDEEVEADLREATRIVRSQKRQ